MTTVHVSLKMTNTARANRAFRAPISSDYRGSYIKDDVAQFILCWCNNSQSLKVVLPRTLPSFTALSVMMPLSTLTRNCGAGAGDDSVIAAPIMVRISNNAFIALFSPARIRFGRNQP